MSSTRFDVVGIGNAIVDIIGRCDDAFLARHGAAKGSMRLVEADTVKALYGEMGPAVEISGGSAANTMVGVASFGGRAAFIGKVADDEFGRIFAHDIRAAGVSYETTRKAGGAPTARSLILVTPDGERTMNTFLGVSPELDHGEVDPALIEGSAICYLEGYLFDRPAAKAAFRQAAGLAAKAGRKVALTLSDAFCVDRHRAEFLELIRSSVDILFANEAEITSLYETTRFDDAVSQARRDTAFAVLTRSAKGSLILTGDGEATVAARPVARVEDTTGAGDLYAAGFLYGLAQGLPVERAGALGSLAAAEIISHVGARPATSLATLAREAGLIG
jgi:sugar/nucleoside kinase (ribokinase family)